MMMFVCLIDNHYIMMPIYVYIYIIDFSNIFIYLLILIDVSMFPPSTASPCILIRSKNIEERRGKQHSKK